MGAGEPTSAALEAARRLGQLVAEAGWILLTGGRPVGVMDAASASAKQVPGSLTIGILPTDREGPISEHVDVAVFTGLGDARNAINVLSSDVVVACGVEGPGTASEVALALAARRPIVLMGASPDAVAFLGTLVSGASVHAVTTPEAVIAVIEHEFLIPKWRAVQPAHQPLSASEPSSDERRAPSTGSGRLR
jgi:uncharacterized protein (TIGR00725 family)